MKCPFFKTECIKEECIAYDDSLRLIYTTTKIRIQGQEQTQHCPGFSEYAFCKAFRTELPYKIDITTKKEK